MVLARHYLKTLVEKMGLGTLQKIVIGYSQGGYLAPFVAQDLPNVSQVMGLNCQFLDEELLGKWPLEMNLICGEKDEMVDPKNSKNSFDRLISKGARGKFTLVEGASHGLSTGILAEVKKALAFTQK